VVEHFSMVEQAIIQKGFDVRFFEIITMLAFLSFKKHKCDYVLLECGIGARIDSTNVVEHPDVVCSAIASIGYDH